MGKRGNFGGGVTIPPETVNLILRLSGIKDNRNNLDILEPGYAAVPNPEKSPPGGGAYQKRQSGSGSEAAGLSLSGRYLPLDPQIAAHPRFSGSYRRMAEFRGVEPLRPEFIFGDYTPYN